MALFTRQDIEQATRLVHASMPPTPQYVWPQICAKTGTTAWVKHENHTPTGAFKIRGGITFIDWLKREHPQTPGIVQLHAGITAKAKHVPPSRPAWRLKLLFRLGTQ